MRDQSCAWRHSTSSLFRITGTKDGKGRLLQTSSRMLPAHVFNTSNLKQTKTGEPAPTQMFPGSRWHLCSARVCTWDPTCSGNFHQARRFLWCHVRHRPRAWLQTEFLQHRQRATAPSPLVILLIIAKSFLFCLYALKIVMLKADVNNLVLVILLFLHRVFHFFKKFESQ